MTPWRAAGAGASRASRARVAALAGALALTAAVGARALVAPDAAPVVRVQGEPYVTAAELARLLGAPPPAPAGRRALVVRAGAHRIELRADDDLVRIDRRGVRLPHPVRAVAGELAAPVALLDSLPRDSSMAIVVFRAARGIVQRAPAAGLVRSPQLVVADSLTRLWFPLDRSRGPDVIDRTRAGFRLAFGGEFVGVLPDSLPAAGLVRAVRTRATATGSVFELVIAPAALGWRIVRDPSGTWAALDVSRGVVAGEAPFASRSGARSLRVLVIDPGHGGADAGVSAAGLREKDVTLALALDLRAALARRLPLDVVLTRDDDRAVAPEQRAEIANRVHADAVLSLHVDALPGSTRRGVTAWCAPAPEERATPPGRNAPIALVPWRMVALRHAAEAGALAATLLGAVAESGTGPTRLQRWLPVPLLGVDAPGVMLDCGTLTSPADRAWLADSAGVRRLADALADGFVRWQSR
jgi:N-acetylmuramoyl-L-alanine amidase